jgi:isochorismate hydrolase
MPTDTTATVPAAPPAAMHVDAQPYAFTFDPATAALVIIDMQRDFVEPGGFGETLGNDVSLLQSVVPPLRKAWRPPGPSGSP